MSIGEEAEQVVAEPEQPGTYLAVRPIANDAGDVIGFGVKTRNSDREEIFDGESISFDDMRRILMQLGADEGEWGGIPLAVEGLRLIMEPRYPIPGLHGMRLPSETDEAEEAERLETLREGAKAITQGYRILNGWYSWAKNAFITVIRLPSGKSVFTRKPGNGAYKLDFWMNTMHASQAWSLTAELKAQQKLAKLVRRHTWEHYMLTGSFLERSEKTGIFYMFRRNRPTIAMKGDKDGQMRILATLCLHPIGYYERSWAGVMVPTDDIIAHLLLMRACEGKYWSKSNHIPTYEPAAGL